MLGHTFSGRRRQRRVHGVVLAALTETSGSIELPPRWQFGLWLSKNFPMWFLYL